MENNIYILTGETFDKFISKYDNALITFYAPWCYHCKKLKPELEKAASILKKENIVFAKLDAITERDLSVKYKVTNYPTIKYFKNKIPINYNGGRKEEEIIDWIRKKSLLQYIILNSVEDMENLKNKNDICIIYFGENEEDLNIFNNLALKYENFPFANIKNAEITNYYKANERNIVLFKNFGQKRKEIKKFNEKELNDFIEKFSQKGIKNLDDETTNLIFLKNKPAIIYFGEKGDIWEKHKKILEKISEKIEDKDNLFVVMTEIKDGIEKRVAERVGIKYNNLPCIRIVENKIDTIKYVMEGNIEESNILNFIEKWENHLLNKFLKSQKEPKENNDIIYILVGKTYKKEVIDNDKDIMVLFYSPSSNESMQLLSIYEKVAKKIKEKNSNIIFAKINGIENEVDSVIIYGFPTIKFYPGNKKNRPPINYRGEMTTDSIIKFIQNYAYNKIILNEGKISDL